MPKLRTQLMSKLPSQHIGQAGHLQFSPDGQHVATCGWDRAAYVWKGQNENAESSMEFKIIGRLVHPGMPDVADVRQVAWSPSGDQLVTQYRGSIALWNPKKNLYYQKHIVRRQYVQSVLWMPLGSGFLSSEWQISQDMQAKEPMNHATTIQGSVLVQFDNAGRQVEDQTHVLSWLQIWDLSIMPNEKKLVAVASLIQSREGHKPINANHQKRILIYNFETRTVESQMPLMVDVRGITLGKAGNIDRALVSYENNAPQTWHIEQGNGEHKSQLKLIKTYYPKPPVEFAGISYFGTLGKNTWVLATSRAGEIYIWDPPSGNLIHTHVAASNQELTGLARNPKSSGNSFMFASAMLDGTVNIWTTIIEPTSSTSSNTDQAPKSE
ncbi:unnamed protein product [Rhizoctonia solani]|uniref:Uncharacterized protein n=1 Tax=Rhizoctonia solani TaxID=456999 RepID=A0A8H2WFV6_9AGAM|nr:unnamed protein product [Rhizoctonia solani]